MKFLVTADTHFSDRPRDAYRFELFPWLREQAIKYKVSTIFILGDLTDQKDRHSANLVNKIVNGLQMLSVEQYATTTDTVILKGNHDFVDPEVPFFGFLEHVRGVSFSKNLTLYGDDVALIPHQPSQEAFDTACQQIEPGHGVFLHQMLDGAIAETGSKLTGIKTNVLAARKPKWAYAGDIHRPQKVGPVTYLGAPYHIRFGDTYQPRVILLDTDTGMATNLYFPAPRKLKITTNDPDSGWQKDTNPGDHVRLTLQLAREELVSWTTQKQRLLDIAREAQLEIYGVDLEVAQRRNRVKADAPTKRTNKEVFDAFCAAEKLPSKVQQAGLNLLEKP